MKEGMVRLPLRDLVSFVDGFAVKSEDYVGNGKYRVLTISNVQQGHVDWKSFQSVADLPNGVRRSQVLSKGDMLISMTGNVGRIAIHDGVPAVLNQRVGKIVPIGIDQHYLYTALSSPEFRETMQSSATGGAQANLSKKTILDYRLPIPASIAEQKQIGEIFQDVNSLIASLERLIAKKQSVKQGMMQQLLTGRTRLPGFQEEWGEHKLGNLAEVQTGSRNNQDKKDGGQYPFFVRSAKVEKIDSFSYDCEAILVPGDGGIGSIFHYVNGKFEVHQRVYKISDFTSEVNARFLYYYMRQFFGRHAKENSVKATVDSLRLPTFENFRVNLPPIEEQQAIVDALRASDEEIGLLHQKLAKARDVKTGMMQELLTGRVQLPVGATV